jgi:hypothetical protein
VALQLILANMYAPGESMFYQRAALYCILIPNAKFIELLKQHGFTAIWFYKML